MGAWCVRGASMRACRALDGRMVRERCKQEGMPSLGRASAAWAARVAACILCGGAHLLHGRRAWRLVFCVGARIY
eukprot:352013-Chlamydomonas_euryale.AAC.4